MIQKGLCTRVGGGFEQAISRILSLCCLTAAQVAIIYLGRFFEQAPLEAKRPGMLVHTLKAAASRLV